ncbi:MAG: carbohydrate binding family 9 domain-containing protein, partial [Saprospiraceae bacterium]|nr:carbohydrate binding family 9 domain-containing protein [Saprospiraceae bacterium]
MLRPLPYFLALIPFFSLAQNNRTEQQTEFSLHVSRTTTPIKVDGDLSEAVWQSAEVTKPFLMKWPRDGGPAPAQTEVRCTYDEKFLYVSAVCFDSTPGNVINSLKRDVGYWDSDGFAVILDPTNTANNGYFFGVNVAGVQTEGLIATGNDDMDTNWDNIWLSEVRNYPDKYTIEFAIPLRILRFKEGNDTWGINFVRNDLGNGIYSMWARVPFQIDGIDLGWTGALHWEQSPKKVKGNYNIIPYANASLSKDYEEGNAWKSSAAAGLDAKIGIGSGMNLDVTLNPDFSQVEIDQQVINLTRFDVQLPEKRTFFLENAD